jgi:hypothetical protein
MIDIIELTFGCRVGTEETSVRVCLNHGGSGFVGCIFYWETKGTILDADW